MKAPESIEAICAAVGGNVAVALEHVERGVRWERLADQPFVAASVIKLPLLAAAYEAAAEGRLRLDEPVRWEPEDQVLGCGVLRELTPGGTLPLRDLLALMVVVSDNTAANLVLERVGVTAVNDFCARHGLVGTRLVRPLMIVPEGAVGTNRVTAADIAGLLARLARGEVVSWDASRRMIDILKRQQFRDGIPALLPEPAAERPLGSLPPWEVANKPGAIDGYQHDVGLVYLPGQCFALAVLTSGLAAAAAKATIAQVARAAYDHFAGGGGGG